MKTNLNFSLYYVYSFYSNCIRIELSDIEKRKMVYGKLKNTKIVTHNQCVN